MRAHTIAVVMLGFSMTSVAGAQGSTHAYWVKQLDKRCEGSPFRLGTDNIPVSNSKATTVVNIWAFGARDEKPVGWLYKTEEQRWWFQANWTSTLRLRRVLTSALYRRIVVPPSQRFGGRYYAPVQITLGDLTRVVAQFRQAGISRRGCFRADLPSSYTGSYTGSVQ